MKNVNIVCSFMVYIIYYMGTYPTDPSDYIIFFAFCQVFFSHSGEFFQSARRTDSVGLYHKSRGLSRKISSSNKNFYESVYTHLVFFTRCPSFRIRIIRSVTPNGGRFCQVFFSKSSKKTFSFFFHKGWFT